MSDNLLFNISIPAGCWPGTEIIVEHPQTRQRLQYIVPRGKGPGQSFQAYCKRATKYEMDHPYTSLINATIPGKIKTVERLLADGVDVNKTDKDGMGALHHAVGNGRLEIGIALIDAKANLNMQTKKGTAALHLAVWKKRTKFVDALIGAKANVDLPDGDGESSLYAAFTRKENNEAKTNIVVALVGAKANLDLQDQLTQKQFSAVKDSLTEGLPQLLSKAKALLATPDDAADGLAIVNKMLELLPENSDLLAMRDEGLALIFPKMLAKVDSLKHDVQAMQKIILEARDVAFSSNAPSTQLALLIAEVPDWHSPTVHEEWLRLAVKANSENSVLAIAKSKGFKGTSVSHFLVEHIHKIAMVKARSPRQDMMLLYLCVALSQSANPGQLQDLGVDTVAAITAAARSRVQDKDLQAEQLAAAKQSAKSAKTMDGFEPIGARATRDFLETTILVPICLLPDLNGTLATASPSVLVKEVLLPNIQRGIQLQIDAAKDCTDLLEKVYSGKRVGHRKMYLATMKSIADADFFKFNDVASKIAMVCAKNLGDKSNFRQSTESVVQFFRNAYDQESAYRAFVKMLAEKTGAEEFNPARIKGAHRALEKMGLRPDGKQWLADNVCDGVRGALVYAEMRNMLRVLCLIASAAVDPELKSLSAEWNAEQAGIKAKIDVLRVKNRFAKPTSGGWADFMISFTFRSDPNKHVCELCHKDLMTVRKEMGAHHEYAEFRSAMELLEVTGNSDRITKIEGKDSPIDVNKFRQVSAAANVPDSDLDELKIKVTTLERQLTSTNDKLKSTQEELKSTQEELKSTQEEFASKIEQIIATLKRANMSLSDV